MIIIAGHATIIDGKIHEVPTNTLIELLADKKPREPFVYIRHVMDGSRPSEAIIYTKTGIKPVKLKVLSRIGPIRYVSEYQATIRFVRSLSTGPIKFIGVDPLNALAGVALHKKGLVEKTVFFCADYSPKRFESKLLNYAYHLIDRRVVKRSDEVWSVSQRICTKQQKLGLAEEKNIFVPNVPSTAYKEFLANKRVPHTLITLGMIGEQLDFVNLFTALKTLGKKIPDLKLKIVGSGPKEEEYKQLVKKMGLNEQVSFLGFMDHKDALREMSTSGIGLALYNGKWSFNYYGDSMKCREYFVFGLPVITTDTHSTVDDIKHAGAGVVSEQTAEGYTAAIEEILANYDRYSKNASTLAKRYEGIHSKLLEKL